MAVTHPSRPIPDTFIRRRRQLAWAVGVTTFAAGVGLSMIDRWHAVVRPGPLSAVHSQLLQSHDSRGCTHCHAETVDSLWQAATAVVQNTSFDQTHACNKCHASTLPSLERRWPHDLAPSQWTLVSHKSQSPAKKTEHEFACGTCHREHHGVDADLRAMSDVSCQACHRERYHSFETDHPEFRDYPPARPTAVRFDHQKHRDLHFAKHERSFDCRSCHLTNDLGQEVVRVTDYDTACRECHDAGLQQSADDGIVFWQLPSVELKRLEAGVRPNDWPEEASHVTDMTLTALLRHWIEGQLQDPEQRVRVRAIGNLSELDLSDKVDSAIAVAAMNASRELLMAITSDGQNAGRKKLDPLAGDEAALLASGLPVQLFQSVKASLFSGTTPIRERVEQPYGGWLYDPLRMAIVYRPTGHGDRWLQTYAMQFGVAEAAQVDASGASAIRGCQLCHAAADSVAAWTAGNSRDGLRGLTTFNHRPHLQIDQLASCDDCHKLPARELRNATLVKTSASIDYDHASDFIRLKKSDCVRCHNQTTAVQSCTLCHDYHVGQVIE